MDQPRTCSPRGDASSQLREQTCTWALMEDKLVSLSPLWLIWFGTIRLFSLYFSTIVFSERRWAGVVSVPWRVLCASVIVCVCLKVKTWV